MTQKIIATVIAIAVLEQFTTLPASAASRWGSDAPEVAGANRSSGADAAARGNDAADSGACVADDQYIFQGPKGLGAGNKRLQWKSCDQELYRGGTSDSSTGLEPGKKSGLASIRIPLAVWLLGSGIVGLIGIRRRRPKEAGPREDPLG